MFNLNVVYAIVYKEIKLLFRHKFQLFYEIILPIIKTIPAILLGLYLVKENGSAYFKEISGTDTVIPFICISIIFTIFTDIQEQIGYFLENEMWMGTLEQLWLTPVKKFSLVGSWLIFALIKSLLYGTIAFFTVLLMVNNKEKFFNNINYPLLILTFMLLIIISVIGGIFISEISLRFKQSDSIIYFITMIIPILSGISYPVKVLPVYIRYISYVLPTTYAYDLLRKSILDTRTIMDIEYEMLVLFILILLYGFASLKLFYKVIRRVELCGTVYLK
jgi:ABC-2 type transporter